MSEIDDDILANPATYRLGPRLAHGHAWTAVATVPLIPAYGLLMLGGRLAAAGIGSALGS